MSTSLIFDNHHTHNTSKVADAATISSSTTYYVNGSNYYTRTSSTSTSTYYQCAYCGTTSSSSSLSGICGYDDYWEDCGSCGGSGSVDESCPSCGGFGMSVCSSCGGSGWDYDLPCPVCDGSGWEDASCSSCGGSGSVSSSCSSCGGRGGWWESDSYGHYMQKKTTSTTTYTYTNIDTGATTSTTTSYSTATKFYIAFNSNGGSGSMSNQYYLSGHTQALNSNTFTRTGYSFLGWSTSSTATSATYTNGQSISLSRSSNLTLYAIWKVSNYTVVFDVSGYQNKVGTLVGGFENTGWSGTYDTAHVRSGSYALKITASTSNVEVTIPTSSAVAVDSTTKTHIYYFQYWGYQETAMSNATTQIYWPIEEPSFGSIQLGPAGQWNQYSFYGSRSSNPLTASQCVRIDFDNRYEAGTIWFDDLIMLDLTEIFGAGNEPSKDWCDKNIVSGVYTQSIQYDTATALTKKSSSLTASGFTFKGWSTTARTTAMQTLSYTDGASVTNLTTGGSSITLYGVWSTNNYLVSAKINKENAGSISNGSQGTASGRVLEKIYSSDSVYVLPANTTVPVIHVVSGLALEVNQKYLLSLNYVATGTIQFDIDLYPDTLPQICPTATTTEQLLDWEFTPTSTDCTSCILRLFNDLVQPTTYAVTITNVAIYKITSSTTQYDYIYRYNDTVSLTATPTTEYFLEYWEVDGATSGTSTTLSFNATANKNIVAHFKLAKTYSYGTAGGEIRLIGNDFKGGTTSTTATYKAVPYAGYYLIGWSVNGEVYKPSGTIYKERTLTLNKADAQGYGICAIFSTDANATPTPSYDVKTGTAISAQLGGEARAVGCDLSTLADTDTITYIAVTDLGYKFDGWYIDGEKVSENLSCRLTKSQVLGKIVEARFSVNNSSINNETNNTDEIL